MLLPYNTDAPLYHYPIATVGVIVATIISSVAGWILGEEWMAYGMLQFGQLNPLQWVTNVFLHLDPGHLIGNMIFLWVFGLIVEGKLGWWRFLLFYLATAVMEGSFVQTILILSDGGASLGASGVIFGLAATSALWAPKNDIYCIWFMFLFRHFICRTIELPVAFFVALFLVEDVVVTFWSGFAISTPFLHVVGATAGGSIGLLLLLTGRVDCEKWDLFSILKHGEPVTDLDELRGAPKDEELAGLKPQKQVVDEDLARQEFLRMVEEGQLSFAWQAYQTLRLKNDKFTLPLDDLLQLATAFHHQGQWSESVPVLVEYLKLEPGPAPLVRLKLAHILLEAEQRPARALRLLRTIDPAALPVEKQTQHRALTAQAEAAEDGDYELSEEW